MLRELHDEPFDNTRGRDFLKRRRQHVPGERDVRRMTIGMVVDGEGRWMEGCLVKK